MVKFDVKPTLTIKPDNSVAGAVKLSTNKWGNEFSAVVTDDMVKGGEFSLNGLQLGLKAKTMELQYGVSKNAPKFIFRSNVTVKDKDVGLKYTHAVNQGSSLEATVKVDDDNKCVATYNLTDYNGPDYKNLKVKWVYTHSDFVVEPEFDLGAEAFAAAVTYKMDDDNKLKASYNVKSKVGQIEWTNSAAIGGGGDLKITAKSVCDADSIKKMPTLMLEKTWDFDV